MSDSAVVKANSSRVSASLSAKKAKKAAPKGKNHSNAPPHPPTHQMVDAAIKSLNERVGSSLPAIKKYLTSTYKVDAKKMAPFINKYLKSAVTSGKLIRTKGKGASGSFKLSARTSKEANTKKPARKSAWIWVKTNAKPAIKSSSAKVPLASNKTEMDKTKTPRKSAWIWLKGPVTAKPGIKAQAAKVNSLTKNVKKSPIVKTLANASHPPTHQMVDAAIKSLNERGGSSLPAIKKYLTSTYKVDAQKLAPFIKKYLKSSVTSGKMIQTKGKGASGSFKLSGSSSDAGKAKPVIKSSSAKVPLASNKTEMGKTKTPRKSAWIWVKGPVTAKPGIKAQTAKVNSLTKNVKKSPIVKTLANASHPSTHQMVDAAIKSLNERGGSSLPSIKKYLTSTYKVDAQQLAPFIKKYLKSSVTSGKLIQTKGKGASGSFKLSGSSSDAGKAKPAINSSSAKVPLASNKTEMGKTKTHRKSAWIWVKDPVTAKPGIKTQAAKVNSATKIVKKSPIDKTLANAPHPSSQQMVDAAIKSLKKRRGSSLLAIKKYLTNTYKVDTQKLSPFIKKYLKSAVTNGKLIQSKGKGASGSFRLSAAALKETNEESS